MVEDGDDKEHGVVENEAREAGRKARRCVEPEAEGDEGGEVRRRSPGGEGGGLGGGREEDKDEVSIHGVFF